MGPPALPAFTVAPGAFVGEFIGPGFMSEGVPMAPDCFNKGVPVGAGFFKSGVPVGPGAFSTGTLPDADSIPPPPLLANGGCGGATIMKLTSYAMFWQELQCAAKSEKVGFTMRGSMLHWALLIWIGSRIPTLGTATGANTPGCVTVSLTWRSSPAGRDVGEMARIPVHKALDGARSFLRMVYRRPLQPRRRNRVAWRGRCL